MQHRVRGVHTSYLVNWICNHMACHGGLFPFSPITGTESILVHFGPPRAFSCFLAATSCLDGSGREEGGNWYRRST
jgi:hypothetical protein